MPAPQYTIGDAPPTAPPTAAPPTAAAPAASPYTIGDAPAMPPRPQPAQDAINASYAPQGGEGGYQMRDPTGIVRNVGYHQVHRKLDDGFLFADKPTLQQYARDHAADPVDEGRVDDWIQKHPFLGGLVAGPVGFARSAAQVLSAPEKQAPASRAETELQLFANTPNRDIRETLGGAGENVAEFMSGEELLRLLGKSGAIVKTGEKFKDIANLSALFEKYPMIPKLVKIGASSVKAGTIAGAQTYERTGDYGAALKSAAGAAVAGPVAELAGAAGTAIKTMVKGPGEAAAAEATAAAAREATAREAAAASERQVAASRGQYAEEARRAIRPHLEATNAARVRPAQEVLMNQPSSEENVMMNQPGGEPAVPTGRRVTTPAVKTGTMARPTETPPVNIDQVLKQTQDFTGAADHLTAVNDEAYNEFDSATRGRFRQLNGQIAEAQNAARKGEEGAAALYKSRLAEMDQLMDSTVGQITPEMKAAAKAGFRQSYLLRDFGNLWDRNLNGIPGASQASQGQRGINGKGLMTDLQRAIKMYGRPAIEDSLGKGRLESLEQIAQQNLTEAQRKAFNGAITNVAQELTKLEQAAKAAKPPAQEGLSAWGKRALAMTLGGTLAHVADVSPYFGMVAGETAYESTRTVMNAIKTNPKIAQNFLFALQSGARAERYGPFIATLIQQVNTESSLERQRQEAQKK